MKRLLVVLAALAVAAVGLVLATRKSDDAPAAPAPVADPVPPPAPVERPHGTTVAPTLPEQPRVVQDDAGVTSYMIDGIPVRDHRGPAAGKPLDLPPNIHPPNAPKIPPALVSDVSGKVRAVMGDCARLLPADARGPKPRLEGEIIVSVKDGTLTVDRSMMQLRDVVGDPEPMRQCMEQKTVGLTANAGDQPDITDYSIHLSFVVLAGPPPPAP